MLCTVSSSFEWPFPALAATTVSMSDPSTKSGRLGSCIKSVGGRVFHVGCALTSNVYGNSKHTALSVQEGGSHSEMSGASTFEEMFEEETSRELLILDPSQWKTQDHYAVIGLRKLRWDATDEDIKRACWLLSILSSLRVLDRKKVLRYHPDKSSMPLNELNENYFKCLQKAYEILSDPQKRRLFDSIDPKFDEDIPDAQMVGVLDFYKTFGDVFRRNAHFSKRNPVPDIGDDSSSEKYVNRFYNFWLSFESWRSFEMMFEVPENFENRDERRYYEKQIKADVSKKRKEENSRIQLLVKNAMQSDPRMIRWKEQSRLLQEEAKSQKKAEKLKHIEDLRRNEEAIRIKEEEEKQAEEIRKRLEKEEKEKERRNLKNLRKAIRSLLNDRVGAGSTNGGEQLESLLAVLSSKGLNALQAFHDKLSTTHAADDVKECISTALADAKHPTDPLVMKSESAIEQKKEIVEDRPWLNDEIRLLVKAIKLFPGGTKDRWLMVSVYISEHTRLPQREIPDIIEQTKRIMLKLDPSKSSNSSSSSLVAEDNSVNSRSWSNDEQTTLEKALKKYPASKCTGHERWEMVASEVPNRTVDEVRARVKELIMLTKKKKNGS